MRNTNSETFSLVGNYLPRLCGIATFTTDLLQSMARETPDKAYWAVAMNDTPSGYDYPRDVRFEINQNRFQEYRLAADFLNMNRIELVCLQHEYGIFGGHCGKHVLALLNNLRMPVVTTLHTVLQNPDAGQRETLEEILYASDKVVVMSRHAEDILHDLYAADRERIVFIPHGIPDIQFIDPNYYKDQFGVEGKKVLLTFGLLSPGKGIENVIDALPRLVRRYPDTVYIVLGVTHPHVKRESGESYRISLQQRARALGVEKHLMFHNRFVSLEKLCEFIICADVYITPYLNREQITSGTLAYALGAGKPIISTPYWYAEDLLGEGRGILVEFRDPEGITEALLSLLGNPHRVREMRANAYEFSRRMTWPEVGQDYLQTFREAISTARVRASMPDESMRHVLPVTGLPRPRLDHLARLTDDTGLLQHARYTIPDRSHGYCTDDNARALVVASKYYDLYRDALAEQLLGVYLSFVCYAQRPDGLFHNFMSYDRQFMDEVGSEDCYGRALWGLGYTMYRGPATCFELVKEAIEDALHNLKRLNLRGRSYATLGLYYYLQRYPEADDVVEKIDRLAGTTMKQYGDVASEDWPWFEDVISYDNAVVPQSLFVAYEVTGNQDYRRVARQGLDFVLSRADRGNRLSLVGNEGWHVRGEERFELDQQPIDACGLVEACKVAFRLTGERGYLRYMRMAFDWFLGVNDRGLPLYNFKTGGCADGLTEDGVNQNQGAESALCYLLALLTLMEISSEQDRGAKGTATRWGANLARRL